MIATDPFAMARSRVLVRNDFSQASITKTPEVMKSAQPITL